MVQWQYPLTETNSFPLRKFFCPRYQIANWERIFTKEEFLETVKVTDREMGKGHRRHETEKLFDKLLSNLRTALIQKRFKFDLKSVRKHAQLYRLCIKNKTHFLFIHVSLVKDFSIPSPWEEISHLVSSENIDWAVILLKEGNSQPIGFLIPSDDFEKMKSLFTMTRMGLIRIKEDDLSLKYCFNSWDGLFHLLNL